MPVPTPPYRFAFGERFGQEAYIVQSSKGLGWCNIPSELEALIQDVDTFDVLDFSLGSRGRYYFKYKCRGVEKRKLSKGLWDEIEQHHQHPLSRLTLGENGQYWGVKPVCDEQGCGQISFSRTIPSFQEHITGQTRPLQDLDPVKFVALGSVGEWAFNVNGKLFYGAPQSDAFKKAMRNAKYRGREVLGVAFSRVEAHWLIIMDDGSVDYCLPSTMIDHVMEYLQPEYMLDRRSIPAPTYLLPLNRNDHTFGEVARLFYQGWRHPHKDDQDIEHIYSIEQPVSLDDRYEAYRSNLAWQGHGSPDNERLLFHGTPRTCYLGNSQDCLNLCLHPSCNLCGIMRTSFQVSRSGTAPGRNFLRFGHGIYTTSVSSKADDYNGEPSPSDLKAMIVARVALGRSAVQYQSDQGMVDPPYEFTSVIGEPGQDLNDDEQVVYYDDAIQPAYLVVYGPRAARGDYGDQY